MFLLNGFVVQEVVLTTQSTARSFINVWFCPAFVANINIFGPRRPFDDIEKSSHLQKIH